MTIEEQLEADIKREKINIELAHALRNLLNMKDFNLVIMEGFLQNYALELVYSRAKSTSADDNVARRIDSVAHFRAYLDTILENAEISAKSVSEAEESLLNLRNEE